MRWTQFLIPTLKETPQEAQIKSHRLMLRAGLIRKLASGTYSYLPLGLRALQKAVGIVREEMNREGALEVLLPALHPAELWRESGRFEILGEDMIHFKDRHGKENVLGPTHEEIITDLVRREVHSYKQLPLVLYQIQTKFRDEMRPRSGIIRSREFIMKDAYSFHASDASLDETYNVMKEAYKKIFTRCGLEFYVVQADPGAMGGSGSQEFVLFSDAGEDWVVQYGDSDVVMSVEIAERKLKGLNTIPSSTLAEKHSKIYTPGHSSVEGLVESLNKEHKMKVSAKDLVKTMIYQHLDKTAFAVLIRGDHEVSDYKIKKLEPGSFMASRDVIDSLGSAFGFSGPFGLNGIKFYIDEDVLQMRNFVTGSNIKDHHLINVNIEDIKRGGGRDIVIGDYRQVAADDFSSDGQKLHFKTAIELGHIFKLNLRYSKPLKANYLDQHGKENPLIMGCYGIGVNRILAAAIEQHADEKGIVWPKNISPFQVLIILIDSKDAESNKIAETLSSQLEAKGVDVLIDDRPDSAGIKFNDADLIGIPLRVILGPKNLKNGQVELKARKTFQTKLVDIAQAFSSVLEILDKIE